MGTGNLAWVVLGVLVHLLNQVARAQGWYTVIRHACPDEPVRRRDALAAWVAGAGAGGILSARGGDAIRLMLLRPRAPDTGVPMLAGTIVAEGVGEAALGITMLGAAASMGIGPGLGLPGPTLLAIATVLALGAMVIGPLRRVATDVARGACALRAPGRYACRVLPWQIVSRLARAAAIACFLIAFDLPVTIPIVLLVMIAQGGGRALPFAPASVAAGAAILAAAFEPMTGATADPARLAAFYLVSSAVLTGVGAALAVVIAARCPIDFPFRVPALRRRRASGELSRP